MPPIGLVWSRAALSRCSAVLIGRCRLDPGAASLRRASATQASNTSDAPTVRITQKPPTRQATRDAVDGVGAVIAEHPRRSRTAPRRRGPAGIPELTSGRMGQPRRSCRGRPPRLGKRRPAVAGYRSAPASWRAAAAPDRRASSLLSSRPSADARCPADPVDRARGGDPAAAVGPLAAARRRRSRRRARTLQGHGARAAAHVAACRLRRAGPGDRQVSARARRCCTWARATSTATSCGRAP